MTNERRSQFRFYAMRVVAVILFAVISARLWDLQVMSSTDYRASADQNRFRLVPVDAPRGIIYDRFGRMLVRNIPSFTVSIVPAGLPEDEKARGAVIARVGELLGLPCEAVGCAPADPDEPTVEAIFRKIDENLTNGVIGLYRPVRIASNVDRQAAFIIEEEHIELPGVVVEVESHRQYLDGALTAHILGYVGSIPAEREGVYRERGYQPDDLVGLTGIERTQEAYLRGIKGEKHVEVDAFEREVRQIALQPPEQGANIILTLDVELQRFVEEALREGMRKAGSEVGVAVAMDPRTGEVLSMVSLPSYDNNLFSGGISYADYAALSSNPNHPLVNHAISGQYPPGSTFKIVPASAALQERVVDPSTRFICRGMMYLPNKFFPDDPTKAQPFYCWHRGGHGAMDVVGAMQQSCDIYFYQATGGYREQKGLGIERLVDYSRMFGFGEPSGVELSGEAAGLLPSDRWKRQNYGESWYTGDTYNASIGQGYVLATPLQVLNATVAIANRGTLNRPQLIYQVIDGEGNVLEALTPDPIRELAVDPAHITLVRQGMREAVTHGTAWYARIPGLSVAGKTGTAEYAGFDEDGNLIMDDEGHLPTHAWFTAFAPYEDPEIALVVFLEGGGEGSQMAAPVAAEILRYYFHVPVPRPASETPPTDASAPVNADAPANTGSAAQE
jgi:penicillin-binding protein 2